MSSDVIGFERIVQASLQVRKMLVASYWWSDHLRYLRGDIDQSLARQFVETSSSTRVYCASILSCDREVSHDIVGSSSRKTFPVVREGLPESEQ